MKNFITIVFTVIAIILGSYGVEYVYRDKFRR